MPVINMEKTGKKIATLRKAKGMTVKEVSGIFGFSTVNAVYKWEAGKSLPTVDNLLGLAMLFDTKIDDLLVRD